MGQDVLEFKIKREKLFDRTLPEARWNCEKYAPVLPRPKNRWVLKSPKDSAKLPA